jgi:hypothetical protein
MTTFVDGWRLGGLIVTAPHDVLEAFEFAWSVVGFDIPAAHRTSSDFGPCSTASTTPGPSEGSRR